MFGYIVVHMVMIVKFLVCFNKFMVLLMVLYLCLLFRTDS